MIAALRFDPGGRDGERRVRRARFVPRSALPAAAACVVANGVREHLARLLAADVETEVVAPLLPDAGSRRVLFAGAIVRRVRGALCDAFVAVRPSDARALVAAAFREPPPAVPTPLSDIERATLDRIAAALVPLCASLCGAVASSVADEPERAAAECAAYFEVRMTSPVRAAVAFALTRDPPEAVVAPLTLDELGDVELPVAVAFARGSLSLSTFARLAEGMTLPLDTALDGPGELLVAGEPFARGTCGARGERRAFSVTGTRSVS